MGTPDDRKELPLQNPSGPLEPGLEADGGGQRTEVGHPYDGEGEVQRGVEKKVHRDPRPGPKPRG
jgi:hypothetical protein